MSCRIERVLTFKEYVQMNEDGKKAGYWHEDPRIFTPGTAWPEPWYFDALGDLEGTDFDDDVYFHYKKPPNDPWNREKSHILSPHYWERCAHKRPPYAVICPNGEIWEIDRWSNNGSGWIVTGEFPLITCQPSIVVPGYHGYLTDGKFSADLEGRGPNGTPREMPPLRKVEA